MTLLIYLFLLDMFNQMTFGRVFLGFIIWFGHLIWWAGVHGD